MGKRVPPHDVQAEEALLGSCMINFTAADSALKLVSPSDFYSPSHQHIFSAMRTLRGNGEPIDPVTVSAELKRHGLLEAVGGDAVLVTLQSKTPASTNVSKYAEIIIRMASYRRAIQVASDLVEACYELGGDPNDLMDKCKSDLDLAGVRIGELPDDLWRLDDYLDQPDADRAPWCIPGLLRIGWRVIIVAAEGAGKTTLLRQIAIATAQGIHPLHFGLIPPQRTLVVDLENPQDSVIDTCNPIRDLSVQLAKDEYSSDRPWLWHRPAGINLRRRTDRIAFESVIASVQPDLVCMGPLYKMYEVEARENDELASREVMSVLDDLRTRYNFGLLMEHHAPKESGGNKRKMMPYGSSLWLRWPEIGLSMEPEGNDMQVMRLGRWRGDRLPNAWPSRIERSTTWPWRGVYEAFQGPSRSDDAPVDPEEDEDPPF